MIKTTCGTPYQLSGSLQTFDPENPEHFLLDVWDEEAIRLGGSPIFYYELFIQPSVDTLNRENRGKIWAIDPIQLYGFYEPIASQNYMNVFGMDSPDEIKFEFNYRAVLKQIGHPPRLGSRLYTPHKDENWVIVQRTLGDFRLWGEIRLTIMAQRFQESTTDGGGKPTQAHADFKLNEGPLFG